MRFVIILVMTVAVIGGVGFAADNPGPAEMTLFGGERGDVPFPHLQHQTKLADCNLCHDLFPKEKGGIERLKAEGTLKKRQVMNKHCIKCHKARKVAGEPSGPTTCKKCHVK